MFAFTFFSPRRKFILETEILGKYIQLFVFFFYLWTFSTSFIYRESQFLFLIIIYNKASISFSWSRGGEWWSVERQRLITLSWAQNCYSRCSCLPVEAPMAPMRTAGTAISTHPNEAAKERPFALAAVLHDNTRWK